MKKRNILLTALVCAALAAAAVPAVPVLRNRASCTESGFAMDTAVTVTLTGADSEAAAKEAMAAVKHLEQTCLSRTVSTSDIARANRNGSARVSADTAKIMEQALALCRQSGGALDIGLGALSDLWAVKQNRTPPAAQDVAALIEAGYEKIQLQGNTLTVEAPAAADLGAVGKGAACDTVKAYLGTKSITRGVVAVGGSVLFYGSGDFTVGISSPERGSAALFATVTTGAGCVSTSGTYERYFDYEGVRYHHILNPETGYPVQNGLTGVTVFSQSGLQSDALATACFVMGMEKGAAFALKMGCEALFTREDGRIFATAGIYDKVTVTDPAYTLEQL